MTRILIVEDDPTTRDYFTAMLRKRLRVDVSGTESAEEVVELARRGQLSLIVMDVSLANTKWQGQCVDGLQLTRVLKGDPATAGVPVLLATAHAMRGDDDRFLAESGADGYVSKPIEDVPAFLHLIERLARKAA